MLKKSHILFLICLFGLVSLCLTNGFADNDSSVPHGNPDWLAEDIFIEGFDFPTADGAVYIQGNPEFQRGPDRIIGDPDFEKMRDLPRDSQDYQLGTKVGWFVVPQRNNPNRVWICTGFLVGPDLFMTNHHCIHDDDGLLPLESAAILMDYYQEPDVDPTFGGITARVAEILRMDGPKDYALLRLDEPIGNTYGWLELDTETRPNSSQSVKLISHNQGRSKEIVRRNSQIVDIPAGHPLEDVPFALAYLADSEGGSSGSPVFLREGTGVIGIHHSAWTFRGEPHFNAGTLMSYIVPEIQQWLPVQNIPDLVVDAPRLNKDWLRPGESFTVSATVRNQGGVTASPTTLRIYQSVDDTITTSDVEVSLVFVDALAPLGTKEINTTVTAPVSLGTYYYGVCVDAVENENRIKNNCSIAVEINVVPAPTISISPPVDMYWTDTLTAKIQRVIHNGTDVEDLVTGLDFPRGLAVDVTGGKMYWTDVGTGKIQRATLDGSNVQDLVTGLAGPFGGLALDVAGNKMYWTNIDIRAAEGSIQRANLDGSNIEDLLTGLQRPYGLALDVAGNKMYWTDVQTGSIQRANLDGSNVEDLVTGLFVPAALALDVVDNKMYWTDVETRKIQRANLDGSNVQDLVTGLDETPGLTLDVAAGKMYWAEWGLRKIQRANLDGSNVQDLVTGLQRPLSIALGIQQTSGTITFNPPTIADQTFTVGTAVSLFLPVATGGTPPYRYTLSSLPNGLVFDASTRELRGTPTTLMNATPITYIAVDATGAFVFLTFNIEVIGHEPLDVNRDGQVDVLDLVVVAFFYGERGDRLPADVNADGIVNVQDFAAVAAGVDAAGDLSPQVVEAALWVAMEQAEAAEAGAGAPVGFGTRPRMLSVAYHNVATAFADARHLATSNVGFEKGIPAVLEELLHLLSEMGAIPETTALLPNYPNPFNPETWIPYHLAQDAEVSLTIYDVRGVLVRALTLGHQSTGVYESRGRAASWDGRNQHGEPVASGLYFYTLTAGDFSATRPMLIVK